MLDVEHDIGAKEIVGDSFKIQPDELKEFSATLNYTLLEKGICLIKLKDKIYQNEASQFTQILEKFLETKIIDFIVELSDLTYICSAGIANLINGYRMVRREGGTIIYVNPNEKIIEVFSICKLDQILQITKNLDDALAYFQMFY